MGRLLRFAKLPLRDKALFVRCFVLLALVSAGLKLFSYPMMRRFLRRQAVGAPQPGQVHRTIWAINALAPAVPGATCLPQALVARHILAGFGHAAVVRIGISDEKVARGLDAHAWVMCRGHVVLGGAPASLSQYNAITDLA